MSIRSDCCSSFGPLNILAIVEHVISHLIIPVLPCAVRMISSAILVDIIVNRRAEGCRISIAVMLTRSNLPIDECRVLTIRDPRRHRKPSLYRPAATICVSGALSARSFESRLHLDVLWECLGHDHARPPFRDANNVARYVGLKEEVAKESCRNEGDATGGPGEESPSKIGRFRFSMNWRIVGPYRSTN